MAAELLPAKVMKYGYHEERGGGFQELVTHR